MFLCVFKLSLGWTKSIQEHIRMGGFISVSKVDIMCSIVLRSTTHIGGVILSFAKLDIKSSTSRATFQSCMLWMPLPLNVTLLITHTSRDPLKTAYLAEWNQLLSHEWHRQNFVKLDGKEKALMVRQNTSSYALLIVFWTLQLVNFTTT